MIDHSVGAPTLASALNQSAFDLGNAGGAWLGASALVAGVPQSGLPYLTAALAAGSRKAILVAARLQRRQRVTTAGFPAHP